MQDHKDGSGLQSTGFDLVTGDKKSSCYSSGILCFSVTILSRISLRLSLLAMFTSYLKMLKKS